MKTRNLILAILITLSSGGSLFSQTGEPWNSKQIMDPASLALNLKDPKAPKPVIYNIGPIEQIKGAIKIGPARDKKNLDAMRTQLSKLPKNKEIVIYCGCCPFQRCPNIRPAFELLNELKFTNVKLLNLSTNLNVDWISKGYPME